MDLQKELREIGDQRWSAQTVVNNIESEKKEIEKKLHLFKIITLVGKVEKAFIDGMFKNSDIKSLDLRFRSDYDRGYIIGFVMKDSDGEPVSKYDGTKHTKPHGLFVGLFNSIAGINVDFVNKKFEENTTHTLEFKPGIEEQILDLLLSEDLKTILNYNKLQFSLPANELPEVKRMKL